MKTTHWAGLTALGLVAVAGCTGTIATGNSGGTTGGNAGSTSGGGAPYTTDAASNSAAGSGGGAPGTNDAASSSTAGSGGSTPVGCLPSEPALHRPSVPVCAPSTPATACTTDADCTTMGVTPVQGKCEDSTCDYNQCTTDTDCGGSTPVCSCQGQTHGYAGSSVGSVCIPGNCNTDADCGAGGFCSPTVSPECGAFYGTQGWYCHTCQDTCINDGDCTQQGTGYCAYDPAVGHWACGYGICAG